MLFRVNRAIESNWRFEYKYRLPLQRYEQLRNSLVPYAEPDLYTIRSGKGAYYLRSLYFDTTDYRAYHEKMGGDFGRTKLRIRSYGREFSANSIIRAEIKTRRGTPMEKFSTFVSAGAYSEFMATRQWPDADNPILTEFSRLVLLRELRPKLIVEYDREGLISRARDDIRLTFDLKVRSTSADELFPGQRFWQDHHRHEFIFEVKCRNKMPDWLVGIIKQHGIKPVANSKYTRAVEVCRHDVVIPMWTQGFVTK